MSNTDPTVTHLLKRLSVLGELIRLSMTLSLEDMLQTVVAKSTEVPGDTALIVLKSGDKYQLETAFCADADHLQRMLMTAVNISLRAVVSELLHRVVDKGESVVMPDLGDVMLDSELQLFVDKHGLRSLIAIPIRGKEHIFGALISISIAPKMLIDQDVPSAVELADFTAMVIENARSATTDSLVGLYNRRFFDEVLQRETARCQRYSTTLSLLMIDVDDFKQINDNYGHPVGDQVLIQIGRILEGCVRATDLVFRHGGDEFSILLLGTNVEGALRVAKKILERVQSGHILQSLGCPGTTTLSIGIAEYTHESPSETLVAHADHALSNAKRAGKNIIRVFDKDDEDLQN